MFPCSTYENCINTYVELGMSALFCPEDAFKDCMHSYVYLGIYEYYEHKIMKITGCITSH